MKNKIQLILLGLIGLCIYACKNDQQAETIPCSIPDTVSYKLNVQPLFNQYCNTSGCHSGKNPAGNLNLSDSVSYAQLMRKGKGYIDTLNPNFSLMYAQMTSVSSPMPPTGKLDKCKTDLVLKWITQKAKQN